MGKLVAGVGSGFSTQTQLAALNAFFSGFLSAEEQLLPPQYVSEALDAIAANMQLVARMAGDACALLASNAQPALAGA